MTPQGHAALGFRTHSGWAVLVAVASPATAPVVLERRRVELASPGIQGAAQPYHAAKDLGSEDADAFVQRCAASATAMAEGAVRAALEAVRRKGYWPTRSCVLLAAGRALPQLAAILAAHPLIHTAEGVFFRNAIQEACERCGLTVAGVREKDLLTDAAARLGVPRERLLDRATELGRSAGRLWRQDEKLAAIAAWHLLAVPHALMR